MIEVGAVSRFLSVCTARKFKIGKDIYLVPDFFALIIISLQRPLELACFEDQTSYMVSYNKLT